MDTTCQVCRGAIPYDKKSDVAKVDGHTALCAEVERIELEEAMARVASLEEALSWYANKKNYEDGLPGCPPECGTDIPVLDDGGKRARDALMKEMETHIGDHITEGRTQMKATDYPAYIPDWYPPGWIP
jgi:hypothetical protein